MPDGARNRRIALAASTLASFLMPFMAGAVNVAIPAIGREFHADAVTLNWVVTAFLVVSAMLLLPFGRLADVVGRRRVFVAGLAVFSLTSALCGLAPSLPLLIAARAAQGAGGALVFATSLAILSSVFPPEERGRVLGINVAAVYLGLSAGPVLGGVLTQHGGWRAVFLATALLLVPALLLARYGLEGEWAEARGERFDFAGAVLCAAAIGPLTVGVSVIRSSAAGPWLAAAGVAAGVAFVVREARTPQPILDVGLLRRNRLFAMSSLAALIGYAATFTSGYLLSIYLQVVRGLDPQRAGALLLVAPAVQAALSPFAGRLSDRVDPRYVASAGMAVCVVGLAGLALVGAATDLALVVVAVGVLGVGFAFFSSPNTNAAIGSVDRRMYGVAAATIGTARVVGMTFSMAVLTLLLAMRLGDVPLPSADPGDLVGTMRAAYAAFAVLCLAGVGASLARGPSGNGAGRNG